jgi:hypothetical protein
VYYICDELGGVKSHRLNRHVYPSVANYQSATVLHPIIPSVIIEHSIPGVLYIIYIEWLSIYRLIALSCIVYYVYSMGLFSFFFVLFCLDWNFYYSCKWRIDICMARSAPLDIIFRVSFDSGVWHNIEGYIG